MRLRRLLADRSGASALEFALVALPFIVTLFASVEFGRVVYLRSALSRATSEAARTIVLDASTDAAAISSSVASEMDLADPSRLSVRITDATIGGVTWRDIEVGFTHRFLVPSLFGGDLLISDAVRLPLPGA